MHRNSLPSLLLALALAGCGQGTPPPSSGTEPPPVEPADPAARPAPAGEAAPAPLARPDEQGSPLTPPVVEEDVSRRVGASINALGSDLWPRLATGTENVTFSPASISAAFAMATLGARGETAAQLHRVMHLGDEPQETLVAMGDTLRRWDGPHDDYTLRVANRLFGERTYAFEEPFLALLRMRFGAPLEPVDYRNAHEAARQHINAWVLDHTGERIRDLLPPRVLNADTRLCLVNALYLDARWETPFEASSTRPGRFTLPSGESVEVPMMYRQAGIASAQIDGAWVVELPYRGGELSMRFILPPEGTPPEAWLTPARLATPPVVHPAQLTLRLPKFRIEPGAPVTLASHFRALGAELAFARLRADFTGIANPPAVEDQLYISEALHKAFVRVDEAGTEAAAATAIVMGRGGGAPLPSQNVTFDRPFLFVLTDVRTGAALFVGRVSDPRE